MPHFATQAATAEWMGTSVDEMNALHDRLHSALCKWLGVDSYSLRVANGEVLSHAEQPLAWAEEDAALHLRRFVHLLGNSGVRIAIDA